MEALLEVWPEAPGAIEISATGDEESGGYGGVAWLAERGWFARVDAVIIPEPLNKDRICLGHRGVWWAELETFGRIAHGSMPFLGDCAVRHMGAVLAEMEESLFPALAVRHTAMPVVPEGAGLDAERQQPARRAGGARRGSPAGPRRWCPTGRGW